MTPVSPEIETPRLLLRRWRDDDAADFAEMNADPEVMRHFPAPLARAESDAVLARLMQRWRDVGFSYWAVEAAGRGFIGFTGLNRPRYEVPIGPCVEVAWRLRRDAWGHGYATEAAQASLAQGFGAVGLGEIVAFAVPANRRSLAVMERLGMTRDPGADFDHPMIPEGSPLRRHLLYRLRREAWRG
jgi:ribosomal-protein-alanine N-acetyltransferase